MLVFKELEFDMFNEPRSDREHTVAEFVDRIIQLSKKGEVKALSNNRIMVKTTLSNYVFYPMIHYR